MIGFSTLPPGVLLVCIEAIDLIVHDDVGKIDITAHAVHEMVAADAIAVAVAAGDDDLELVIGHLRAGGYRQRAAMQCVHAVGADVAGQIGRASDAADHQRFVRPNAQFRERHLQRAQHTEVAAARTPIGLRFAFEILDGQRRARLAGAFGFDFDGRQAHRTLLFVPRVTTPDARIGTVIN
jgi:hypothetical protein